MCHCLEPTFFCVHKESLQVIPWCCYGGCVEHRFTTCLVVGGSREVRGEYLGLAAGVKLSIHSCNAIGKSKGRQPQTVTALYIDINIRLTLDYAADGVALRQGDAECISASRQVRDVELVGTHIGGY